MAISEQDRTSASKLLRQSLGPGTAENLRIAQAALDAGDQQTVARIMALPGYSDMFEIKDGRIQQRPEHAFRNTVIAGLGSLAAAPFIGAAIGPGTATTSGGSLAGNQALGMQGLAPGATAGGGLSGGSGITLGAGGATGLSRVMDYVKPALAGASLIGGAIKGNDANDPAKLSPELRRLLELQKQRMEAQNPLFEAVTRMAWSRLPESAKAGLSEPSFFNANAQVPPATTPTGSSEPPEVRDLLRQQEVRLRTQDPVFQAIQQLAQSRLAGT